MTGSLDLQQLVLAVMFKGHQISITWIAEPWFLKSSSDGQMGRKESTCLWSQSCLALEGANKRGIPVPVVEERRE